MIWAAGETGSVPPGIRKEIIQCGNRLKADRFKKVEGASNIYAVGDIACMEPPLYPKGHPQVANVAINQAKLLAKNLKASLQNKQPVAFEYKAPGSMATVGKRKAVVDLKKLHFQGS